MDVNSLLEAISGDIKALKDRQAEGENVEQELAEKEAEKERVTKAASGSELEELQRLRAEKRETEEKALAERAAMAALKSVEEEEQARAERIKAHTLDVVKSYMGQGAVDDAVKRAIKDIRGGSRFVGPGADETLVDHVASGGSVKVADRNYASPRSTSTSVKALQDSKNIVTFMGAIARHSKGRATDAEREWLGGLDSKALAEGTASSGGYLVPQEWMPDILGLLRAEAVVRRAGPRIVPFNKQMNQTSVSTGATAYYTAENAAITPSEETFAEVPLLTPKNLTGLVPVSNYLLNDAPQAEAFVRADLTEVLALREDLAFLRGTGTGGEPTGFRNMASITLNPITVPGNGFQITLGQTRRIKAVYRALNARAVRLAWFFNPAVITYLETLVDTQGRFLADANILQINDDQMSGVYDGVPFFATNQLPANQTQGASTNATEMYLVNMAETIVGENMSLEIDVSSEASYTPDGGTTWISSFQNAQTLFRAIMRHDITHRRPSQVVVQAGILV
jgi:HK97 family phage major capsid protein